MRTGALIVYTSADSVFQIAAHEEIVPVPELYRACEIAYRWSARAWASAASSRGRSSARPARFKRTANRHDYALPPSGETLLDRADGRGCPVVAIGKIEDLFAGRGIGRGYSHGERRRRHGPGRRSRWRRVDRGLDLREPRRLRHAVRPSQRRRRATPQTSSGSTAAGRSAAAAARRRSAHRHRRSRQRSDDAEHRSRARVRAAARHRARTSAPAIEISARGQTFADLGQTLAEIFSASARWRTARSFLRARSLGVG